jgi:opacity protein-like surface antigen
MTETGIDALIKQYQADVDAAFTYGAGCEYAPAEKVFRDVYADGLYIE